MSNFLTCAKPFKMNAINCDEPFKIPILGSESILVGHDMSIANECLSLFPKTKTWVIVTDSNLKVWLDDRMKSSML